MGNIADNFKGLPIEDLIVSPLVGMAKGQAKLNDITWKYIKEVAFDEKGNTNAIDVNILRYVKPSDGGTPEAQTLKAKVPMLPLVPLPALAIKTADIEFSMEVQQSEKSEDDLVKLVMADGRNLYSKVMKISDDQVILNYTDVTSLEQARTDDIIHVLQHDSLTGLPNQVLHEKRSSKKDRRFQKSGC